MISKKPQGIPTTPGVYFFKNSAGEIIYVGKAGNLKNRLASYFNKSEKEPKTKKMLEEAVSIEWQELGSEIEALITESEQIKFHEPKYNILMRDGKSYSYVAFTDDIFPRVFVTHESQLQTTNSPLQTTHYQLLTSFIGPFTDATALRSTLAHLRRIFHFCTCTSKHNRYCLNYHIGKCRGYCCLKEPAVTEVQIDDYKRDIKAVRDLLTGNRQKAIKDLEKEMEAVASLPPHSLNECGGERILEKAIELKEQLEKIKTVFENAKVIKELSKKTDLLRQLKRSLNLKEEPRRIEGYDVANIQG
ncbi:MAG: GIY-YIG nuclease family protein [Minisyncoccia bacterium]|jgi:excinuclease ABC subunit C